MLLRYIVSNFKSIGETLEFTMFPLENSDKRFLETVQTKAGKWKVLKRSGLFGPNASGKSSFVQSIKFSRDYIVDVQKGGSPTRVNQFKGNVGLVSTFQYTILVDKDVYEYGFSLDKSSVRNEWLNRLDKEKFISMFVRTTDSNGRTRVDIGEGFDKCSDKEHKIIDAFRFSIGKDQKNQLFLSKLSENNVREAEKIVKWFGSLTVIFPTSQVMALPIKLQQNKEFRNYFEKLLNKMDTGVEGIKIKNEYMDLQEFSEKEKIPKEIVQDIESNRKGMLSFKGNYYAFEIEDSNQNIKVYRIEFNHHLRGKNARLEIKDESDGTKRLLDLLPMLYLGRDGVFNFVVDELDRSLHTKLSQYILDQFVAEGCCSQIIFTAHDVNLINLSRFRQEEIWFVEKSANGISKVRSLSDFKIENGQDVIKAYLSGRFGAIPSLVGEENL